MFAYCETWRGPQTSHLRDMWPGVFLGQLQLTSCSLSGTLKSSLNKDICQQDPTHSSQQGLETLPNKHPSRGSETPQLGPRRLRGVRVAESQISHISFSLP